MPSRLSRSISTWFTIRSWFLRKPHGALNCGFGDVRTPIKNLYCVGTDTEKRSAGVNRSAYSVIRFLNIIKSEGNLKRQY